jgi:uncharacterized protein
VSDCRLIVFVKAPRAGFVKTRLAAALGPHGALAAYRALVDRVLGELSSLRDVELRFSPDDAASEISAWLRPGWSDAAQGEGDLGARMNRAFGEAFASGATRVVLIGSDCPHVTIADIAAAAAALADHDAVLGPAEDGGYWLVALRASAPGLFAQMEWSTADVLARTLARAQSLGLRVHLLRSLPDVDTVEDWQRYLAHGQQQ